MIKPKDRKYKDLDDFDKNGPTIKDMLLFANNKRKTFLDEWYEQSIKSEMYMLTEKLREHLKREPTDKDFEEIETFSDGRNKDRYAYVFKGKVLLTINRQHYDKT